MNGQFGPVPGALKVHDLLRGMNNKGGGNTAAVSQMQSLGVSVESDYGPFYFSNQQPALHSKQGAASHLV